MSRSRISLIALTAALLIGPLTPAAAQDPAAQVDDRQSHMKQLGGAMRTVGEFLKGTGTTADVETAARTVVSVGAKMPGLWFPGTAVGVGDSDALPALWTEQPKADGLSKAMEAEGAKLLSLAAAGDKNAIGQQFKAVLGSCKACHDLYQKPK
jgi:cytochrome c556